ncbi:helix-turn-helix domain-containing protein [Paenibacillus sp. GCM10027626]|uniref:response regulator transcription factor n=1 Tax=Paenibacillus sp. GCM10027626 TaxID=3273411 RepID=UPI00364344AF
MLIIDDEPFVRAEIKENIDWREYGYDRFIEADNGLKGLECYRRAHPDLILTDIRMPVMDGIVFCTELMKLNRDAKVIVLSSYLDFEYVREAFKLGVVDYLPKHQMNDQYIAPIMARLESEREEQAMSRFARQVYLRHWLHGQNDTVAESFDFKLMYRLQLLQIEVDDYGWQLVRMERDSETEMSRRLYELADCELSAYKPELTDLHEGVMYAVLECPANMGEAARHSWLNQLALELHARIAQELGWSVSIVYNGKNCTVEQLPQVAEMMRKETKMRRFRRRGEIRGFEGSGHGRQARDRAPGQAAGQDLLEEIRKWLRTASNKEELRLKCERLWLQQAPQISDWALRICFNEWLSLLGQNGESVDDVMLDQLIAVSLDDFTTYDGLYDWALCGVERIAAIASGELRGEKAKIREIEHYVRHHLQEDLSLDVMAKRVHFNKGYLSEWFKRQTGTTYSKYVNDIRIEAARRLLTQSDLSIRQISEQVGFNDEAYFIRKFKEATGSTPGKFLQKNNPNRS